MDINAFLNASLNLREATIEVPQLADFFGDEPAEWTIRGLTAAEMAKANEAGESGSNIRAIVDTLAKGEKAEAIKKLAGVVNDDVPEDVSRRIQMLVSGSVSPKLDENTRDVAVRLAETFPTVFYNLTNKILSLTGQGAEPGKRKASGKKGKSET
jgi:hypothetical protein